MTDKIKKRAKIVTAIDVIVCVVLLIGVSYISIKNCPLAGAWKYILPPLLCLLGVSVGYLIHNAVHELFHALFAKMGRAKVFEVAFWGLVFSKGKVEKADSSLYAGWTSFVPKKPEYTLNSLLLSLFGGLLGSLLCIILANVLLFLLGKTFLTLSLIVGADVAFLHMLVLNFLTGAKGTDGAYLLGNESAPNGVLKNAILDLEFQSKLMSGLSAKECERSSFLDLFEEGTKTYQDLLSAVENGKKDEAKALISTLKNDPNLSNNGLIALLLEELFLAIVENDFEKQAEILPKVDDVLDGGKDLNALRASYALKVSQGEEEWARATRKTLTTLSENCPLKGLGKTQLNILELYFPEGR